VFAHPLRAGICSYCGFNLKNDGSKNPSGDDMPLDFGTAYNASTNKSEHADMKRASNHWHWLTVRTAATLAAMLAGVSFFFISNYRPRVSFIGNVMTGTIPYEPSCLNPFDVFDTLCGGTIPYRWILAVLVAFVSVVALKHRKT
jgi:hypothetical protein